MRYRANSVSWPDRVLIATIGALVLLAWWALWLWGRSPYGHVLMHGPAHLAMAQDRWMFAALFVAGWTLMTTAMMLPTTVPLLVLFNRMVERRARVWLVGLVIVGYLAVWTLSGVLLAIVNWYLHSGINLFSWPASANAISGAVLLSLAGLYQFSSLKQACMKNCRSPLALIMSRWHGGNKSVEALRIGAEHGLFCVGCCWSLMLIMFVVGAGSLIWMLVLGAVMALEKNLPWGRKLSGPIGVTLLACAAIVLLTGLNT